MSRVLIKRMVRSPKFRIGLYTSRHTMPQDSTSHPSNAQASAGAHIVSGVPTKPVCALRCMRLLDVSIVTRDRIHILIRDSSLAYLQTPKLYVHNNAGHNSYYSSRY